MDSIGPLVSVIVPAYNAQDTIRQTLDSILNQTHSNLEVIVVDDGSEDDTIETVLKFCDPRIRVVRSSNNGQAHARNRGIEESRGEYTAFCDADDLWLPKKIARQIKTFQRFPEIGMTHSWACSIDSAGATVRLSGFIPFKGDAFVPLYRANFFECGSTTMIPRKILDAIGSFDISLTGSEDWDLWCRIAKQYSVATTPFIDVLYRQIHGSQSKSVARNETTSYKVIDLHATKETIIYRRFSKANIACYSAFKALDGNCSLKDLFYYVGKVLRYRPLIITNIKIAQGIFSRLLVRTLFPYSLCLLLYTKYEKFFRIEELLEQIEFGASL